MGVQLYLSVGLMAVVVLGWMAMPYRHRESALLAREVDNRLRKSAELLSTIPSELRR